MHTATDARSSFYVTTFFTAGALAVALAACGLLVLAGNHRPAAGSPRAGTMNATAGAPVPSLPIVRKPVIKATLQVPARMVVDPFIGGPKKISMIVTDRPAAPPPVIACYDMPAVMPSSSINVYSDTFQPPKTRPLLPAPARCAGILYNEQTGQVVALVEDRRGETHTLCVGNTLFQYHVHAITPDAVCLLDDAGMLLTLPLQPADTPRML